MAESRKRGEENYQGVMTTVTGLRQSTVSKTSSLSILFVHTSITNASRFSRVVCCQIWARLRDRVAQFQIVWGGVHFYILRVYVGVFLSVAIGSQPVGIVSPAPPWPEEGLLDEISAVSFSINDHVRLRGGVLDVEVDGPEGDPPNFVGFIKSSRTIIHATLHTIKQYIITKEQGRKTVTGSGSSYWRRMRL